VSNESQLRKFRQRESAEKFARRMKEASAGMQPGQAQVYTQFAQLGNILGQKVFGAEQELSADDQQGLAATEAFNAAQDAAEAETGYANLDAVEKSFVHQQSMVTALQQSGQHDQALQLAAALHQQRLDHRLKSAQARKLEAEAATEEGTAVPTGAERASAVAEFHGDLYSATEKKQHRELIQSTDQMTRIADNMVEAFEKAGDPRDIVGTVGGMNQLVSSVGKVFSGGLRAMQSFAEVGEDGIGIGKGKTANEWTSSISDEMIPESIRGKAQQASAYKAAIMQMVYADARLNEPGARQLSDNDITNAMVRLGVNSNDPQTVIDVFFTNMDDRLAVTEQKFSDVASTLEPVGGAAALKTVYGRDIIGDLSQKRERISEIRSSGQKAVEAVQPRISHTPGEATNVGVPLTPGQSSAVNRYLQQ
jgi:hypothetical protein